MTLLSCPECPEFVDEDFMEQHLDDFHSLTRTSLDDEEAADVVVALRHYLKVADKNPARVPAARVERLKAILRRLEDA